MDAVRVGSVLRAVRLRRGWRQSDVAHRAGVSQASVSRAECGHFDELMVGTLLRIAAALDVRLDWIARWRGGELDRMLNAGHAAMHAVVAGDLARCGWLVAPESTFSVYGERGSIDLLCFHPPTGTLLVIELKTQIVDVNELAAAVDRYRRLAPGIAREKGWRAEAVACWVVVLESRSNRRRVQDHAAVLRAAFPDDGRQVRGWLRDPSGPLSALSFLPDIRPANPNAASSGVQRVRRKRLSTDSRANLAH